MKNRPVGVMLFLLLLLLFTGVLFEPTAVKAETGTGTERVLAEKVKFLRTNRDIVVEFGENLKKFRKNFNLYITKDEYKTFDDFTGKKNVEFWNLLYTYPEYSDMYWGLDYDQKNSLIYDYGKYWVWNVKVKRYRITKSEIKKVDKYVSDWVKKHIKKGMSQEEKVRAVNDFMIKEFKYSFGDKGEKFYRKNNNNGFLGKYSNQSCFSLVFKKGGVCNGKANLFARLVRKTGIKCRIVIGVAGGEGHAWNMVKVNGRWYHVDVTWGRGTWDGTNDGKPFNTRAYYMKSDRTMRKQDHKWNKKSQPRATKDYPEVPAPIISDRLLPMETGKISDLVA